MRTQPGTTRTDTLSPYTALFRSADALSGSAAPGARQPLSLSLQVLVLMTLLSVLPAVILMMTSFTRIIIVLSILRKALGLAQTPPTRSADRRVGKTLVRTCTALW